jgi:putative hydrolase of HD superfamily
MLSDVVQLEMILQAQEYEQDQGIKLQEFFDSTEGKFKTELGQAWAAEIRARREAGGGLG